MNFHTAIHKKIRQLTTEPSARIPVVAYRINRRYNFVLKEFKAD